MTPLPVFSGRDEDLHAWYADTMSALAHPAYRGAVVRIAGAGISGAAHLEYWLDICRQMCFTSFVIYDADHELMLQVAGRRYWSVGTQRWWIVAPQNLSWEVSGRDRLAEIRRGLAGEIEQSEGADTLPADNDPLRPAMEVK
ncbi:hypothetical protein UFOVP613_5 [uncultured Caudovirales phage]|uniref:Uncharacterized protein n=1 Tax=uncultured Caudovirales phage TaxID=2100421 RepID=A0A6J5MYH2_9CAUD|nr:hypothetical protein UFOVP613_5 [uncultured Caudovirales phage]